MAALHALRASASRNLVAAQRRGFNSTAHRYAITNLQMPAMSPTMTEGGISQWKKKEGESFSSGDVILEVETDKATIDVEAQDDGVIGKILVADGAKGVPVGKVIAILAEEGDDISNLEAPPPKQAAASSPPPPPPPALKHQHTSEPSSKSHSKHPEHSRPLFPSVLRLLQSSNIENPENIKGTGVRGMLTKGDILAYLGKASSPTGTYKENAKDALAPKKKKEELMDGPSMRAALIANLITQANYKSFAPNGAVDFDSILAFYSPYPRTPVAAPSQEVAAPATPLPSLSKLPTPKDSEMAFIESLF